ncbi:MAG: low molecular weight protein arginine phosphatase [Gemmatimonadota bacterium]
MTAQVTQVLVVCSGNTCRSPLAAAILADLLAADAALAALTVSSAGTGAREGAPASEGSYLIALERGLDLSAHRSQQVSGDMVREADLILTMSEAHARRIAELGGAGKVHLLTSFAGGPSGDIPDPFGQDVAAYRETADRLELLMARVAARLRRAQPT